MADPDIARRCHHCGISIREQAYFCPQCGRDLNGKEPDAVPDTASASEDVSKVETISDSSETPAAAPTTPLSSTDADLNRTKRNMDRKPPQRSHTPKNVQPPRDQRTRATAVARDRLEDNVLQRVERLRKVSSVVIDQASYDPSLRFVLVAAALFFLFLVIVVASKLIG